jgi:hypothetical protein
MKQTNIRAAAYRNSQRTSTQSIPEGNSSIVIDNKYQTQPISQIKYEAAARTLLPKTLELNVSELKPWESIFYGKKYHADGKYPDSARKQDAEPPSLNSARFGYVEENYNGNENLKQKPITKKMYSPKRSSLPPDKADPRYYPGNVRGSQVKAIELDNNPQKRDFSELSMTGSPIELLTTPTPEPLPIRPEHYSKLQNGTKEYSRKFYLPQISLSPDKTEKTEKEEDLVVNTSRKPIKLPNFFSKFKNLDNNSIRIDKTKGNLSTQISPRQRLFLFMDNSLDNLVQDNNKVEQPKRYNRRSQGSPTTDSQPHWRKTIINKKVTLKEIFSTDNESQLNANRKLGRISLPTTDFEENIAGSNQNLIFITNSSKIPSSKQTNYMRDQLFNANFNKYFIRNDYTMRNKLVAGSVKKQRPGEAEWESQNRGQLNSYTLSKEKKTNDSKPSLPGLAHDPFGSQRFRRNSVTNKIKHHAY